MHGIRESCFGVQLTTVILGVATVKCPWCCTCKLWSCNYQVSLVLQLLSLELQLGHGYWGCGFRGLGLGGVGPVCWAVRLGMVGTQFLISTKVAQ